MNQHPVILFDGVCNLCHRTVQFLIRRDRRGVLRFAALQSGAGRRILREHHLPEEDFNSVVLIDGAGVYERSEAVLRACARLGRGWGMVKVLLLIPPPLRDALYRWVARHRYRWFGKRDACMVPTEEQRGRFLEDAPTASP